MVRPTLRCKGFALLESVIALLIFSLSILGTTLIALKGLRASQAALDQAKVISLIEMQYDRIKMDLNAEEAWKQRIARELPQGKATILQKNKTIRLTICWSVHSRSAQKCLRAFINKGD